MSKTYFTSMPSVLCKIFGVYKVGSHNKETDRKITENVVVMESKKEIMNRLFFMWNILPIENKQFISAWFSPVLKLRGGDQKG